MIGEKTEFSLLQVHPGPGCCLPVREDTARRPEPAAAVAGVVRAAFGEQSNLDLAMVAAEVSAITTPARDAHGTSHNRARTPLTPPHHSLTSLGVLPCRRFDVWRARLTAELPQTTSARQLLLLLRLLRLRPKVRQHAPSVESCCPHLSAIPRHHQPRHMHRARTLRKTGGTLRRACRPYRE